jgi:DNA-binding transcriptional LysR family regulator
MDKFKGIRTFVTIAEQGSLTAAARRLEVSLPTVVRTLAELERHLGITLFQRTTRRIRLTDDGQRYLDAGRHALGLLEEAEQAMTSTRLQPGGRLSVTSSVLFGRMHVAPLLSDFLKRHRDVTAELILVDRVVDLVEEGIDVGVRIAPLPDSSLHATRVGEVRRVLCASPGYLRRRGRPVRPDDLARHSIVSFSGLGPISLLRSAGQARCHDLAVESRWATNSIDAAMAAVADGIGIGQFLSYMVEPLIRDGGMQYVLESFEPPPVPVTIVYPHSRVLSARVRAFVDAAAPRLRERLAGGSG